MPNGHSPACNIPNLYESGINSGAAVNTSPDLAGTGISISVVQLAASFARAVARQAFHGSGDDGTFIGHSGGGGGVSSILVVVRFL
jgi:hypothetical protein